MKPISQSKFKRFDFRKPPMRQMNILRPLTWLLSYPDVLRHHSKITRVGTENLKPPYLLLCNHNSFFDFKVTTAAIFPDRANYVVAIDGFIKREWLLRAVGCICKRKFTNDTTLIRQLLRVVENGDVAVLYPEARYSLCGTTAVLPASLGKLAKLLGVPVVTLIMNGHHINSPCWSLSDRGCRTEATLKLIVSADELGTLSIDEINSRINTAFYYDDFAWQKKNKIQIKLKNRAKGLHKVLYQCPHCLTEYKMDSDGDKLWCSKCGKTWQMSEYGELSALEGNTEYSHIPDWYEWERSQVKKEVEERRYLFSAPVDVFSLPNSKGYIPLGGGTLVHDMNGFRLEGVYNNEPYTVERGARSLYSCHIEYNYLGKYGDCIDLSTLSDTYYIYPQKVDFSVTKIALATEELYDWHHSQPILKQTKG